MLAAAGAEQILRERPVVAARAHGAVFAAPGSKMSSVNAEDVPIADIMTRTTITARPDTPVESLIAMMNHKHIGCVPIVDAQNRPTGIVTRLDLLECRGTDRTTATDVMMPNAISLPEDATLARAATLMSVECIHHLLIVDKNRALVGVVTTFDITRWVAGQSS